MATVDRSPPRSSRWVDDSGQERRERRGKGRRESEVKSRGRGAEEGKRGRAEDVSTAGSSQSAGRRREQQTRLWSLPGTLKGREAPARQEVEDSTQGEKKGEGERRRGRQKSKSVGERSRKVKDVSSERENSLPEREKQSVRREKRDNNGTSTTEVTQRAPFSFLMPLDNDDDGSGAESAHSFSEVSVSAASIAFSTQWPLDPISPLQAPGSPTTPPGPWLVPSPHKLSQVLEGKRLSQKKGGLWS